MTIKKINIIFSSSRTSSPSFQMYYENLINSHTSENLCLITGNENPKSVDYLKYEVALFMGFDPQIELAKKINPNIKIGIVEPRATQRNNFEGVDFIVVNSLEAKDYFSQFGKPIFLYPVFPVMQKKIQLDEKPDKLILGYHGNKIHLDAMIPRITDAIDQVAKDIPLELWAMYNIEKLGRWIPKNEEMWNFKIKHIQFHESHYAKYIANVDIGLVPQFIPFITDKWWMRYFASLGSRYGENDTNYILRFKDTTNFGRHLVFAQYQIPVISDMTPSACSLIEDGMDGFTVYSTAAWKRAIQVLANDSYKRAEMGEGLWDKVKEKYSINQLNHRLCEFISKLINQN